MDERLKAGVRDEDHPLELTEGILGVEFKEVVSAMDTEETILYAFERAGLIEPLDKLQKPINRLVNNSTPSNELNDRRDDHELTSMLEASDERGLIQQQIDRLINLRRTYDGQQLDVLKTWGRKNYGGSEELPPVQQVLKELILARPGSGLPEITDEASALAPDIYWMMLREDQEAAQDSDKTGTESG